MVEDAMDVMARRPPRNYRARQNETAGEILLSAIRNVALLII
jgi:hypothetical protein